ncbi:MAG: helix-turn-helix domain-containing protein [Gordonia sp. (in: high G+C Gram-positive bacteria)]
MTLQLDGRLARRGDLPIGDHCPIDRTMQIIGNRTAILLLREALYGATRFESLRKRVGVTDAVAAQRLKELVSARVLEKRPYREPGQRTRHEYILTEAGHALLPVVIALLDWGGKYAPGEYPAVSARHAGCGAPAHTAIRCEAGHDVPEDDLVIDADDPAR